jgi:hypothetical protein
LTSGELGSNLDFVCIVVVLSPTFESEGARFSASGLPASRL